MYTAILGVSAFTACVLLLRRYMRGGKYTGNERLDGKVVIITGGNVGLGKETARELAARGGHVVMACRDLAKAHLARDEILSQTRGANIEVMKLDLASFDSIREFCEEVKAKFDKVDILINNAGLLSSTRRLTQDGLESTMGVCHFGHFMLTNILLEKLKLSKQGRIIFLSSKAQETGGPINFDDMNYDKNKYTKSGFDAYGKAKVANILCTREMAKRLVNTNVTVNSLHPGVIKTEIGRDLAFLESLPMRILFIPIRFIFYKSLFEGIQTTLRLALDPALNGVSGKYFSDCVEKQPSPQASDDAAAKRLWDLSVTITKTDVN